jgi:hypothetical protein
MSGESSGQSGKFVQRFIKMVHQMEIHLMKAYPGKTNPGEAHPMEAIMGAWLGVLLRRLL